MCAPGLCSGAIPIAPGTTPALKVLSEQFEESTTPDQVDRTVTHREVDEFYERLVRPRLRGVQPSVRRSAVCLYTNTVDDNFLIDFHPRSRRILVASPCSGHGFKHSTGLAENMVELVTTGSSTIDLTPFSRSRTAGSR